MIHQFEQLSQNDLQWANVKLGLSNSVTIGQAGCFITSFSVLAYYYGHKISPVDINSQLINANLFSNQDLISSDDDLYKLFNDIVYVESNHYENSPADLNLLKNLLTDVNKCVIVEIDLGDSQVHFTPVVDCDGTNVTIMNVWNGKIEDLKSIYGDPATKILKFIIYQGTPAIYSIPDTIIEIKQVDFIKLMQKSEELDKIGQKLNFTQSDIDSLGFSDKVIEKFTQATTSTPVPSVVEAAPIENSSSQQPLTPSQTTLLQKILGLIGFKLRV